jgi:PKHD-type hydroxylase
MWNNIFFSKEWVERVHRIFEKYPSQQGDSIVSNGTVTENYLMKIAFSAKEKQLAEELKHVARKANESLFGFNIWYDSEVIQYTTYDSSSQMSYPIHSDSVWFGKPVVQKLTVVVGLTDANEYKGGEFIIIGRKNEEIKLTAGQAIVFPSIALHEVKPVTQGVRNSLVTWFKGPRWQ